MQRWIERIPVHIQEVIRLEGGNEYKEGRNAFKKSFIGRRLKGQLSQHALPHHAMNLRVWVTNEASTTFR